MGWFRDWFRAAKDIIFSPQDFLEEARTDSGTVLKFAATSLLVQSVLYVLLGLALGDIALLDLSKLYLLPVYPLIAVIGGVIAILVSAGITHIFVYLLGGRGFNRTLSAIAYPTAVTAFFGWIPLINLLAGLYVLYVEIRGIEAFHGFSFLRAAVAVLLLPIILLFITLATAAVLTAWVTTFTSTQASMATQELGNQSQQQVSCSFGQIEIFDTTVTSDSVRVAVTNTGTTDFETVEVTALNSGQVVGTGSIDSLSSGNTAAVSVSVTGPATQVRVESQNCPTVVDSASLE